MFDENFILTFSFITYYSSKVYIYKNTVDYIHQFQVICLIVHFCLLEWIKKMDFAGLVVS